MLGFRQRRIVYVRNKVRFGIQIHGVSADTDTASQQKNMIADKAFIRHRINNCFLERPLLFCFFLLGLLLFLRFACFVKFACGYRSRVLLFAEQFSEQLAQ